MSGTPAGMALVWRLAAATTLIVLAFAMAQPVLAVRLQQLGHATSTVGLFAMVPFALVGLLIPVMPRWLARWGLLRAYRAGAVLELAGVAGYALFDGLLAWTLASVVGGAGAAALWNATEALLAREAPPAQRGRVMGLYQTALGAALALGPFAPALLGWPPRALLAAACALVLGCVLIALLLPRAAFREPPPVGAQGGTWHALRRVPALAFLAFAGGVFESGLGAVSAAHASALGLSLGAAASVAGAIGLGSFLCQYPAGAAADRLGVRAVFTGAALLLLLASLALLSARAWPGVLWASGAVWGGVGGALYTLTMVRVAQTFQPGEAAGGTAAMISGYTAGGVVGPVASGAALQAGGLGLLAVLLATVALLALVAARRLGARTP